MIGEVFVISCAGNFPTTVLNLRITKEVNANSDPNKIKFVKST